MQTQSPDAYVFVVLCLFTSTFLNLTFFHRNNVFCDPAIFYHRMQRNKKREFLAHKRHWNATVCAAFTTETSRKNGEICYQTQINDQEECRSYKKLNVKKRLSDMRYVILLLFRRFHFFCFVKSDSFDQMTVFVSVGACGWLMNQLNISVTSLASSDNISEF